MQLNNLSLNYIMFYRVIKLCLSSSLISTRIFNDIWLLCTAIRIHLFDRPVQCAYSTCSEVIFWIQCVQLLLWQLGWVELSLTHMWCAYDWLTTRSRRRPTTDTLIRRDLHWLRVPERIVYRPAEPGSRRRHGTAPLYLWGTGVFWAAHSLSDP